MFSSSKAYSAAFDVQEDLAKRVFQLGKEFGWTEADYGLLMTFASTFTTFLLHDKMSPRDGAKLTFRLSQLFQKFAPTAALPAATSADLRILAATALTEHPDDAGSAARTFHAATSQFRGLVLEDEFARVSIRLCDAVQRALYERRLIARG